MLAALDQGDRVKYRLGEGGGNDKTDPRFPVVAGVGGVDEPGIDAVRLDTGQRLPDASGEDELPASQQRAVNALLLQRFGCIAPGGHRLWIANGDTVEHGQLAQRADRLAGGRGDDDEPVSGKALHGAGDEQMLICQARHLTRPGRGKDVDGSAARNLLRELAGGSKVEDDPVAGMPAPERLA